MEIPFEKITLPNGLDVIFHQERSLPLVSVNVWYHVGSKDEAPGKTGFAHLFEHIMFEGTKHHNASHFEPLQKVGAVLNGSTTPDRTNYWENVPANYLELALWLEADRMGFLLDALDQRRFDVQRDVVKNERRQSYENRPYGMAYLHLTEATYPSPHPYHWPTIGYHEDLDAASLDDVKAFFQRWYTPANASLAVAGDFDLEEAKDLVHRYFADLPPGPSPTRIRRIDSPLQGKTELTVYDKVLLPRLYLTWPAVPRYTADEAALDLLTAVLAEGKSSRLHNALVYEKRIAQGVGVYHAAAEIAGAVHLEVTAAAGHTLHEGEQAALQEIERLQAQGPTSEEVERAKNYLEWQIARQVSSVGGFGGRANRLNTFNVFRGDPALANKDMGRFMGVQPEDIRRAAQTYLAAHRGVRLEVLPEPQRTQTTTTVDRTKQPPPALAGAFTPPLPKRQRMPNGLQVLVVEKRDAPLVSFGLALSAGGVADPPAKPGLAAFTSAMLQEGTASRTSQQIAREFEQMGAQLSISTGREQTLIATETLSKHWETALEIIADIAQNPTFPEHEMERVRKERLTALRRMNDDPNAIAMRVAPMLLYGAESAYGHPLFGNEAALSSISRGDLEWHFKGTFGPRNATLVVAGDVSLEDVVRAAQAYLGGWQSGAAAAPAAPAAEAAPGAVATTVCLVDKPGAAQSVVRAGRVSIPRDHPDYLPIVLMNQVFGGQFTARLNLNLRQNKGYSYGYNSFIEWHTPSSLLMAGGSVQTEVTKPAVEETLKEFREIGTTRPVEEGEFQAARDALLRQLPSSFETAGQIADQLIRLVEFHLPDDYFQTFVSRINVVTLADVRRAAQQYLKSEGLTVLVVGDRARVEPGLRELGLPLRLVDAEGKAT
ncbi:MAG: insulinase family protein [Chloroflexi bacterium]|nr:insulinase family protein [Chloroflexota bacterium]